MKTEQFTVYAMYGNLSTFSVWSLYNIRTSVVFLSLQYTFLVSVFLGSLSFLPSTEHVQTNWIPSKELSQKGSVHVKNIFTALPKPLLEIASFLDWGKDGRKSVFIFVCKTPKDTVTIT